MLESGFNHEPDISEPIYSEPAVKRKAAKAPAKTIAEQPPTQESQAVGDMPTVDLLDRPDKVKNPITQEELESVSRLVEAKLMDFGIEARVVGVYPGPVITRFELDLAPGVKVSKISGLSKDLARALSAISVRVVEVIPGKSVIGLELPNKTAKWCDCLKLSNATPSRNPALI